MRIKSKRGRGASGGVQAVVIHVHRFCMGRGRIFVLLRLESNKPSEAHGHRCWVATGAYAFRRRPMPTCLLCRALLSRVEARHCRHGVCFTLRVHFYLITNVPRLCGPGVPGGAIEFEMIVDRTVLRDAANATSSARSVRRSGICES